MKIAQITSVYISVPPKTYGGTERIVHYLCRDLRRRGHDVELFASGDSEVDCTLQSVLPIASQDDSRSTFYLEKEFEARNTWNLYRQSERFDVIHAHWTTIAPYFSNFTMTPTLITYAYIEQEIHEFIKGIFRAAFRYVSVALKRKCWAIHRYRWFTMAWTWTIFRLATSPRISF